MKARTLMISTGIIAIAMTISILFGYFMPEKRVRLFPVDANPITLYSDEGWGGQSTVTWINKHTKHWQCNLIKSEFSPVCGLAAELSSDKTAVDFSGYKALSIKLKYSGEATKLRIYLRNYNPNYSTLDDPDSFKFNSVNIPAKEFDTEETIIQLSEFSVEKWWLEERKIPRNLAQPELNHLFIIGLDFPYPQILGEHSIEMESIELIGPLFERETYYFYLLMLWTTIIAFKTLLFFIIQKRSTTPTHLKRTTIDVFEVSDSPAASINEPFSKNDLNLKIKSIFDNATQHKSAILILFKVTKLQDTIQTLSKSEQKSLLLELHKLVAQILRPEDAVARWGEEEFLILSTDTNSSKGRELLTTIRDTIVNHEFELIADGKVSVSIGGTCVMQNDDFGKAFMRAEQALYKASTNHTGGTHWI